MIRPPVLLLNIAALHNGCSGADVRSAIADCLRDGRTTKAELDALADLIDPATPGDVKLVVARARKGRVKLRPKLDLQMFMEAHVDFFGAANKRVTNAAMARFSVGRTACAEALAWRRAHRAKHPPIVPDRDLAVRLRDMGVPDYQPLGPRD